MRKRPSEASYQLTHCSIHQSIKSDWEHFLLFHLSCRPQNWISVHIKLKQHYTLCWIYWGFEPMSSWTLTDFFMLLRCSPLTTEPSGTLLTYCVIKVTLVKLVTATQSGWKYFAIKWSYMPNSIYGRNTKLKRASVAELNCPFIHYIDCSIILKQKKSIVNDT